MSEHKILRLGHKGDGIAPGPVFVRGALPGEVVEGDAVDGRIDAPRIIAPSPERIRPPCRHYKACGGCALQHASDAFVADWKSNVVQTALEHHGISVTPSAIHTSPPKARRRAVLHGRRTKKGVLIGLYGRASDTLVEIPDCILMTPEVMAGLPFYERLVELGGSRRGELDISVAMSEGGLDVSVTNAKPLDLDLRMALAQAVQTASVARLVWNGEQVVLDTPPTQRFGRARVVPPGGAFLQATAHGEATLVDAMRRAVGDAARVVDLFAGCGTFSLPLAETAEVHAVETVADMMTALSNGWRKAQGLKAVTTETRDLFRQPLLSDELNRFDAIVIDPPRAGAEAQCREIAASAVSRIGFVSCNPVTFARDAKILMDSGYLLDWVEVIDQFRWSTHVELAAKFSKPVN